MSKITVTEHALVQYFSRVLGVDVEYYRELIRNQVDDGFAEFSKGASVRVNSGNESYVVRDGKVVTVNTK